MPAGWVCVCAGHLFFYCLNCPRCCLWLLGSTRAPAGLLRATMASEQLTGGEETSALGRREMCKGLFSPVQPGSDHLDTQQTCWHDAQPWPQAQKPFCSAGKAAPHTALHLYLNSPRVLMQTWALAAATMPRPGRL